MVSPTKKALSGLLLLGLSCATVPFRQPVGPDPEVLLLDGDRVSWPSLFAPQGNTLVVFATPWCEICRLERPEVEAWARAHRDPKRTVYVFSGGKLPGVVDEIRALKVDSTSLTVVVDADGSLGDRYAVQSTPTLLVVGTEGRVLSVRRRFDSHDLAHDFN
jgi:thiol-disulfide isomerase/thioredoxin